MMVERVKEDTDSRSRQYVQESMDVMDNKLVSQRRLKGWRQGASQGAPPATPQSHSSLGSNEWAPPSATITPTLPCTQTDLMAELDEYEAVLKRSRQESAANAQELSEWKRDVARKRSRGHFFQSLYTADKEDEEGAGRAEAQSRSAGTTTGRGGDSGRASAEAIQGVAASATSQSLSRGLLLALGSVLLAGVAGDLLSDDPSARTDVLYTCLAGLAFWLALRGFRAKD